MDSCSLTSTGLQDIEANDIIADNITTKSSLNVQGVTFLNSIKNLNNFINTDLSTVAINATNNINFTVNNAQF